VTELFGSLHAPDSSRQFRAEETAIGGFVGEPSHGSEPLIDAGRGKTAFFQAHTESGHHDAAEGQARLGAVPGDEFVHGKLVGTAGSSRAEAIEDSGFGMVQIAEPEHGSARL
jgi:hypothetical protein